MRNYRNHIEVLQAIQEVRAELPACAGSEIKQGEVLERLSNLYSCLDVADLTHALQELSNLDKRRKVA